MKPLLRSLGTVSLLAVACAASAACSSAPPNEGGDELDYELFSSTRQLGEADLAAIASSDEDGKLVFASEPPALAGVATGQVLLGGISPKTPAGLLRVVTSVERSNGGLVLTTAAAPLQLAFRRLHARVRRKAETSAAEPVVTDARPLAGSVRPQFTLVKGQGEREQRYEIVVFDGDGDPETKNDQIAIDATFGGGYDYELSVDIDWGAVLELPQTVTRCIESLAGIFVGDKPSCAIDDLLPEAKMSFDVEPDVRLDVAAHGAATLAYEKEFDVGTIPFPPVPFGPLVFVPTIDILASVDGGASARFDVGASAHAKLASSVVISTKTGGNPQFNPPEVKDWGVDARPPTVDLHASATASVGARLNVSLYSVAGPYATARGVAQIDAAPLEDPCWKVRFALEADLGARITSPRLPIFGYVTLIDWHAKPFRPFDEEVARGSCVVPPDPPQVPGSGPTPRTYQAPPFAPWAKVLGGEVDGTAAAAFSFVGTPDLVPSIDGRWVAAGKFARGLHKVDGDGALTWTAKLVTPEGRALRALASTPTRDAGIMALLDAEDAAAFVLAKTGQSGALEWAKRYDAPGDCNAQATHMVPDAEGGFVVVGSCSIGGQGWLAHVDHDGSVLRARTLEEAGARVLPAASVLSDGEVVATGQLLRGGDPEHAFVVRLDAEDRPKTSTAFACPERLAIQPMAIAPSENGGVTVVGTSNGLGLVARVRKDGALGFARFPNLGEGVPDDFIVSSVAELPTTGMVIGASTRDVSESQIASVVLAGLDGSGSALWARRYAIPGASRSIAWPAVRLTDDGGALVTALAGPAGEREGDLFAMKVHAKDGNLGDGAVLTSSPIALGDVTCATSTRPFAPTSSDLAVTAAPMTLRRE